MEKDEAIKQNRPNYDKGLSDFEIEKRINQGLINSTQDKITKTNWQIFKDNVLTVFNLFNFLIGVALALVGAYTNMAYLLIILLNIGIGIVQEIRARNLVNKLSLVDDQKVKVVRNGAETEISSSELVLDDIVILEAGKQIPADSIVVHGKIEVNESLLTGEADLITKHNGDKILSGSFVVSGKAYVSVERVGADNFAAKLVLEAKKHKKINSKLLQSMRKVTKFTSFFIVPIGIIMFLQAYFARNTSIDNSVVSSAAALLGMLPKGLVLLISIALAAGVINLSKKRILVQGLYSLENLARTDVICLDKTGTITNGEMSVSDFYTIDEKALPISTKTIMNAFVNSVDDNNTTFDALKKYFSGKSDLNVISKIPFSSERKWSAITFSDIGTIVVGAPEKLYGDNTVDKKISKSLSDGKRVLCVGFSKTTILNDTLPTLKIIAVIEISDTIRKNARETLDFFHKEGVDVKIISGDNLLTVAGVAKQAGFKNHDSYIDMSKIKNNEEIKDIANKYSIFGRVTPKQKQLLIRALKSEGKTVTMVGDGVNDVLALKEADCGIAMASGSDAAKQVSQLVLMDSDFTSIPDAVKEGRRVVNNVTRVAGVFFIKTIYSVILSLMFIAMNIPFPFAPIQITLIDLAIEGYPALFMSFEKSHKQIKGNFLSTSLRKALPNALLIVVSIISIIIMSNIMNLKQSETLTIMYFVIGFISLLAVFRACLPLNKLRLFLSTTSAVGFYIAIYLFSKILKLTLPTGNILGIILIIVAICIPLVILFSYLVEKFYTYLHNRNNVKNQTKNQI